MAHHDPENNVFFHDFNSKSSYQIASMFINERVDVNQYGPSLIFEPPPPRAPQIPINVNVLILWHIVAYMKNLLLIVFLVLRIHVSSVMRSSSHFGTPGFNIRFPRTSTKKCMLWILTQKSLSDYLHILHVVETIALV